MKEGTTAKTFGEDITKLVSRIDFYQNNIARANLLAEPVILDSEVFRTRSHTFWVKAAKGESANIVLVDCGVEISIIANWKSNCIAKLFDLVKERE
jgi:hypothetical protein